ncbi:hypothetical protein BT93_L5924 [Corymbia citriodora subsp. variegata]|uniref:Uncharacterized protein n=1 Tax=Corymbia citriodora subsp. variegata TaxID=360336 RepID=A0A8T0CQW5_CORYI|nr:hypothetical protein BT93_L5924 [Corymbia citriodora subsp. variegata]
MGIILLKEVIVQGSIRNQHKYEDRILKLDSTSIPVYYLTAYTLSLTNSLSKLNFFVLALPAVSKLKSTASSSAADNDFQEVRNSFRNSASVEIRFNIEL